MAAAVSEAFFYSSLSSSPQLMGRFESESTFNSLFMANSGQDCEHIREMSFSFWPPGVPLPAAVKDLVNAGFFYTGDGETIACYSCDIKIPSWKDGGGALERHRQLSPSCHHLRILDEKVPRNQQINKRRKSPKTTRQNCSFAKSDCESLKNQTAESMLSGRTVEHVVKPAKDQTSKFSSMSSSDRLVHLKAENERLRTSVTCIQCHSAQVQTLMLPCCHIVCCETCAEAADDCPQCRARILGTVKIFMS